MPCTHNPVEACGLYNGLTESLYSGWGATYTALCNHCGYTLNFGPTVIMQVPGQDAKALLLRYARKSQNSKGVFYNCRK